MRTPSSTPAALESILGARGFVACNSITRPTLRKWIAAKGYSSSMAAHMTSDDLARCYNDESDAHLRAAAAKWETVPDADGNTIPAADTTESAAFDAAIDFVPVPAPVPATAPVAPSAIGDQLAALIGQLTAKPSVDVGQVQALIDAALANHVFPTAPARVLEIRIPDRATTKIEGLHHHMVPTLIQALSLNFPIMLVGPAGSGKTTAASQACEALNLKFYIMGACDSKYDMLGFVDASGQYHTTPFREAFENGGTVCLDEVDAGDAGATLVMNAALANGHMAFPDKPAPVSRHPDFRVIACANTFGLGADRVYVGRNQLDAATLDRFFTIEWNYDTRLEMNLAGNDSWVMKVQRLRDAAVKVKARVVISPRASIMGAKALAAGMPESVVLDSLVWKGVASDVRARIEAAAH
jgi:hypothetical protein